MTMVGALPADYLLIRLSYGDGLDDAFLELDLVGSSSMARDGTCG